MAQWRWVGWMTLVGSVAHCIRVQCNAYTTSALCQSSNQTGVDGHYGDKQTATVYRVRAAVSLVFKFSSVHFRNPTSVHVLPHLWVFGASPATQTHLIPAITESKALKTSPVSLFSGWILDGN